MYPNEESFAPYKWSQLNHDLAVAKVLSEALGKLIAEFERHGSRCTPDTEAVLSDAAAAMKDTLTEVAGLAEPIETAMDRIDVRTSSVARAHVEGVL